jgi:hypothetical protein
VGFGGPNSKGFYVGTTGLCHAAVLSRDDKNELLMGVDKSHVEDVARVLELVNFNCALASIFFVL